MKQLLVILSVFALSCSDNNKTAEPAPMPADSASNEQLSYAYTAEYSSQFELGNPKHAQIVLNMWKDWDNNSFENSRNYFADTVTLIFGDGTQISVSPDSLISISKHYRSQFSSMKSTVGAWVPLRSKDKNEDWVAIWGKEVHTMGGKNDSIDIHEIWRINDDNKIVFMRQYHGTIPKGK